MGSNEICCRPEKPTHTYITVLIPHNCWNSWSKHPSINARRTGCVVSIFPRVSKTSTRKLDIISYSGFSSTRVFSSTRAPPKTQIAPLLVTIFFNMPWLTPFWIKYNRKYEEKRMLHKIVWENVHYSNFTLFIFTYHSLVARYGPKMLDSYTKFFSLVNEP